MKIAGLFTGMQNATRAMQYAQFSLNIHSQNISRSQDPNHTRRELITPSESGSFGPGVKRLRDLFIDDQFRNSTSARGFYDAKRDILARVEDIFGDPVEGGLRRTIDQFFDKWQALAENPSDGVARLEVLSAGRQFVQQVKFATGQLDAVERRANEMLVTRTNEVNTLLKSVYELNGKIQVATRNAPEAADMRDQRDAAIDKLAELTGGVAQELSDGTVRIMIGGMPVVDGPTIVNLRVAGDPPGVVWSNGSSVPFSGKGVIGGLLTVRDGELEQLQQDLMTLAKALADKVNEIHETGQGLDGVVNPGRPFFLVGPEPFNLNNFTVNPDLEQNPNMIAAGTSGFPADGSIARLIGQLADERILTSSILPGQMQSPRAFYRNVIGWVGSQAREIENLAQISKVQQDLAFQQRQSNFGVSLDEEVAFLTLQQKSFAASARVFNVMDEMLDRLINGFGR